MPKFPFTTITPGRRETQDRDLVILNLETSNEGVDHQAHSRCSILPAFVHEVILMAASDRHTKSGRTAFGRR